MILVGLDISLNGTGGARLDLESGAVRLSTFKPGTRRGHSRTEWVLGELATFCAGADMAVIEGLSYGSKSSSLDEIYGFHMLVRQQLWRRRIPYAIATPADIKMYVTGNGNAGKLDMVRSLRKAFPKLRIEDDNQADALGAATMGARFKNQVVDAHVLRYSHVLEKVRWPDQDGEPRAIVRKHTPRSPLAR